MYTKTNKKTQKIEEKCTQKPSLVNTLKLHTKINKKTQKNAPKKYKNA
jgi:hypothetical protein